MSIHKSSEEIATLRDACLEAKRKLNAHEYTTESERQALVHACFPYAITGLGPRQRGRGCLRVGYDPEWDCMVISDHGGFLTTAMTQTSLWHILEEEAITPGTLRERLTGINPYTASDEAIAKAHERELISKHSAQRYDTRGKPKVTIEDLELDL